MFQNLESSFSLVIEKINAWISSFITMLPNLAVAIIVLLAFGFLSRLVRKVAFNILNRVSHNVSVNRIISKVVSVIVLLIGIFVSLGVLNLDKTVTSLLAGAGIIGLALSFAFQDTATNFISGVIMAFRKSFSVGDLIQTNDIEGVVQNISLRSTVVKSSEGYSIIVPNKMVLQNPLYNYNTFNTQRVDVNLGVSYDDDLDTVEEVTLKAINQLDFVLKTKGVEFYYNEFGDSSINFVVRFWIDFKHRSDSLKAQSAAIKAIKKIYDEHNFNIPFPIRTLDIPDGKGGNNVQQLANTLSSNGMSFMPQNLNNGNQPVIN